jgi:hypothetical protein
MVKSLVQEPSDCVKNGSSRSVSVEEYDLPKPGTFGEILP